MPSKKQPINRQESAEYTPGFIGPSNYPRLLKVPNSIGQSSLPPHIELTDPYALFSLFIGDEQLIQWCKWTNENAESSIAHGMAPHSRNHDWHEIDLHEMRGIIAIVIIQGIYALHNHEEYWHMGEYAHAHYSFTTRFSLRRYEQIWRFLKPFEPKLSKSSAQPHEYTKMQCISEKIMSASQLYWRHGSDLCIDESMIAFQGRTMHKVTLKNKPITQGYKVWILADHGYALLWLFYTPKDPLYGISKQNLTLASHFCLSNTEKVSFCLAIELLKKCPFQVYVDNLFTSDRLAQALYAHGIGLTGVCRAGALIAARVRDGEIHEPHLEHHFTWYSPSVGENRTLHIGFWDRKYVTMITSVFEPQFAETMRWRRAHAHEAKSHINLTLNKPFMKEMLMPHASIAYNYEAKQTDLHNQLRALHEKQGRNIKNWHPIFVQLINIAVTNAYLLTQRTHAPYKHLRAFKMKLITQLMEHANQKRKRPYEAKIEAKNEYLCTSTSHLAHFELTKAPKTLVCVVCRSEGTDAKRRRRPLAERSANTKSSYYRAPRSTWRCPLCSKSLCKSQQCIDRHLNK